MPGYPLNMTATVAALVSSSVPPPPPRAPEVDRTVILYPIL